MTIQSLNTLPPTLTELKLEANPEMTSFVGLERFTLLEKLDLSGNTATFDLATVLPTLTHLKELNLTSCNIRDLSFLKSMTQLTTLILTSNPIENPEFIGHLKLLRVLHLNNCSLTRVDFTVHLKALERLSLYSNQLHDLSSLQECQNLIWLDVSGNPTESVIFAKPLAKLEELIWVPSGIPPRAIRHLVALKPHLKV